MKDSHLDPVCGMTVDPDSPAATVRHADRTWLFCSTHCKTRFVADPDSFTGHAHETPGHAHASVKEDVGDPGARDTCPMHPEVQQRGPGSCPICGMALEPAGVAPSDDPDPELLDVRRRLIVSVALTVPVIAIAMGDMLRAIRSRRSSGTRSPSSSSCSRVRWCSGAGGRS